MKICWLEKELILSLICLFIGVSVSPCIIAINNIETINSSNITTSLVGYWSFNEGSGYVAIDGSGYNNHGIVYGATWTEGIKNKALLFDGDRDYVLVQDNEYLNFADTNEFTLDVWIKWDGTINPNHDWQTIIDKCYGGGYRLQMQNDGTMIFEFDLGAEMVKLFANEKIDTNWHHITAIWVDYTQYLYIDGALDAKEKHDGIIMTKTSKPLEFGNSWGYTDSYFDFHGIIDEIKIYENAKYPNNPPNKPTISYKRITNELTIKATDPDGDQIKYGVDWDSDYNVDQWTDFVDNGTEQNIDCKGREGMVGIIVEDENGAQCDWVFFKSKDKSIFLTLFLQKIFQRFSLIEKILKQYYN